MLRYYSNLLVLESDQKEGVFCKGRGWQIEFESNPSSNVVIGPNGKPPKEIVICAQSGDRAQYVANMILAAHCLYCGELSTFDTMPVFQNRAQTTDEIAEQLMAGGGRSLSIYDLPVSCLIAAKVSQQRAFQYAIFKYLLSCRTVPLGPRSLDPSGDWIPGKAVSELPEDHVLNAYAIILAYSVLEELSFDIRASDKVPSRINGRWNPEVKHNLQERLVKAMINLSDPILWHLRDTPTKIERERQPASLKRTEWAYCKVRDVYLDVIEAVAYASWLRSKVSAHRLSRLAESLTIYDVANVQHLARRLLLERLGFWLYYRKHSE